jgi:hypothetical protein
MLSSDELKYEVIVPVDFGWCKAMQTVLRTVRSVWW